jgi:hypothetical protein
MGLQTIGIPHLYFSLTTIFRLLPLLFPSISLNSLTLYRKCINLVSILLKEGYPVQAKYIFLFLLFANVLFI